MRLDTIVVLIGLVVICVVWPEFTPFFIVAIAIMFSVAMAVKVVEGLLK
jgi:hypothetical protein